jgi:O-antigen ligase
VGLAVFALAYDGGTYDLLSRHSLAVALWWTVGLLVVLRLVPRARLSGAVIVAGGFLAALALFTALSIAWAPSAEGAFREFDRVALYLGVFVLVALICTRGNAPAWCDGLAIGLSAVAAVALASRFFPGHFSSRDLLSLLPGTRARLTFPVDYWNGLGILLGLAFPLLLRAAVAGRTLVARTLAVAPFPALAASIYLTSSRGGVATALIGTAAFLMLTGARWRATAAVCVGAAGAAAAIGVLLARDELVDGPLGSAAATRQGHSAALLIGVVCVATALVYAPLAWYRPRFRAPAAAGWASAGLAVVLAIVAIALAHPVRRFDDFKLRPATGQAKSSFISSHLLSGRGNGRWQFWSAAVDEFQDKPLAGHGAGTYESWWAQHGSFAYFTRYAHSLYLQTLGELGLIGLLLLGGAFVAGAVGGMVAVWRRGEPERTTHAAPTAGFLAFAIAAAVDWMWELTIVTVVGIACLAIAVSGRGQPRIVRGRRRLVAVSTVAAVAVALVIAEAVPLLGELELRKSQDAAERGDTVIALEDARTARNLEPWAASPYLQTALVDEESGRLQNARRAIESAIDRSPDDWRLWLVDARIKTRLADISGARRSIARAARLNPRSPIFAQAP